MVPKRSQGKYKFDSEGFVHIWTDAATRGRSDSERASAAGYWLAPCNAENFACTLDPPIKNNAAEALAVTMGVTHLIQCKISKIHVHTDSQYFADLINSGYLIKNNPSLYKYENYEILEFFVDLEEKLKTMGWDSFELKVSHPQGSLRGLWQFRNQLGSGVDP